MEFINKLNLTREEEYAVGEAFRAAEHSVSTTGHKVGCAILCNNGEVFVGATNERSRAIGSTCAERMAVDQLYFHGNKKPKLCVLVGIFVRDGWSEDWVCTPCGVCLEMFSEIIRYFNLEDMAFLCLSWDKSRFLRAKLSELYPQIGKGKWRRTQGRLHEKMI